MSVIGSNILAGAAGQGGGYVIDNSLRFRSSASAYLNRTPATAGNTKTWTWSGWVKRGNLGGYQTLLSADSTSGGRYALVRFESSDKILFYSGDFSSGTLIVNLLTTQVFRDCSAWYHIVVTADIENAVSTDRARVYVNGERVTSFDAATYPATTNNTYVNQAVSHNVGRFGTGEFYLDGYLTEVNFIDGQALTPSDFGEYNEDTGVWQPVAYSGSYGTNGFYLPFSDATNTTTLAEDASGNGNDWTPNNISLTSGVTYDSMTDTPTPYADGGNYAVLNPLNNPRAYVTYSNANLTAINTTNASHSQFEATQRIGTTLPKIYWEVTTNGDSNTRNASGIGENIVSTSTYAGAGSRQFGWYVGGASSVFWRNEGVNLFSVSWVSGDVLCFAYEPSTGKFYGGKNGTFYSSAGASTGDPATDTNPTVTISSPLEMLVIGSVFNQGVGSYLHHNFGQRPFAYTPPAGFKSLHTGNLPDSAIVDGSQYFDAVLWTGDGSEPRSITGVGFQPDFVWGKRRDASAVHLLADVVRGADTTLSTEVTNAEEVGGTYWGHYNSFDADGFTVDGVETLGLNNSGSTYVAWNWKAGGAAVTNTAGSITSQVSASPTAGFSVVTYTGTGAAASVGHGLGATPSIVIIKDRDAVTSWLVIDNIVSTAGYTILQATDARATLGAGWAPDSTKINLDSASAQINTSGRNYISYCFSEVPGYSKFGSYTGNGSTDGPFVFTGFRPAFVMMKRSNSTGNWTIFDTGRQPVNLGTTSDPTLYPNLSIAEATGIVDILSNGFKIRYTDGDYNTNGGTYIYMAFAENPFKNSLAR
jgi:hypothetical protein